MSLVKGKKMDPHLVSNQSWELQYVAKKFGITVKEVSAAKKITGRSRRKLYSYLRATN